MESFCGKIRDLRIGKGDPLRKVAAYLDIDQAILSKIETGKRIATRENVLKLEEYFSVVPGTLIVLWLADRIVAELRGEELALDVIRLSEKKLGHQAQPVPKENK